MRKTLLVTLGSACMAALVGACASNTTSSGMSNGNTRTHTSRLKITAQNNPTYLADRGTPDLGDHNRPAAWVFVDGHEGRFIERDGQPQLEWIIEEPVSTSPTFRVEVYPPLLKKSKNFRCLLQSVDPDGGSGRYYAIASDPGTFVTGRDYPLLAPGGNFVLRVPGTTTILDEIPPLTPGNYIIAASIENAKTGKKGLAVTHFTVADPNKTAETTGGD